MGSPPARASGVSPSFYGSDHNGGREHFPRVEGGTELAAGVDRAVLLPMGSERQGPIPVITMACLSRHLFAIANLAFAKMLDAKQNQCIIIR